MKLALITGGSGIERDISIKSARNFYKVLFYKYKNIDFLILPEDNIKFLKNFDNYDIFVPLIHGLDGEDGKIFAMLELFKKIFLYSDYKVHLYSLDKFVSYNILNKITPIADFKIIFKGKKVENVNYPLPYIIKPRFGGSSIDTLLVKNKEDIKEGISIINKILKYDDVIVQSFIGGYDEISIGIFGDKHKGYDIIGITEIVSDTEFFDYEAKYNGRSKEIDYLEEEFKEKYKNWENLKKNIYDILNVLPIRTMARIDYLVNKVSGDFYFLELNTIPGFTDQSIMPRQILKKYKNWDVLYNYIENLGGK